MTVEEEEEEAEVLNVPNPILDGAAAAAAGEVTGHSGTGTEIGGGGCCCCWSRRRGFAAEASEAMTTLLLLTKLSLLGLRIISPEAGVPAPASERRWSE